MNALLALIGLILVFELIRDSMRDGDFIGYVNAGNAVLHKTPIYADYLNTWPPFFSVFSVILALGDGIHPFFIRFIWNLGSIFSLWIILRLLVKMVFNTTIGKGLNEIRLQDPILLVPLLIVMRFVMDNLSNVQINIYMMLCALLSVLFFQRKQYAALGFVLALSISIKVYTVFFLLYFIFKREYLSVLWTFVFIFLINASCLLVFGLDQGLAYFQEWYSEVAPQSFLADHKNQSVFGMALRYFTTEDPGKTIAINLFSFNARDVIKWVYIAISLIALLPAYLFRHPIRKAGNFSAMLEFSILFTVVPLLSPLAWKYYFIFLWLPYFLCFISLFKARINISRKMLMFLRSAFILSVILNVFSSDLFLGNEISDVTEAYSFVTIGTLILLFTQIYLRHYADKFQLDQIPMHIQKMSAESE